ncbi:hypothetical protein ACIQV2_12120 [Streptomyces globosus]|uniref:hypothetical protein n=1 Tax=Streptomyces globosus TaxID=68209 RepID=UPI0037F58F1F
MASLNEKQRTAKPAGVEAVPTGRTHGQMWKDADTAGKRDLLLNAGAYVEVGMSRKGGPRLDTSRLAVYFGEDGEIRARTLTARTSKGHPTRCGPEPRNPGCGNSVAVPTGGVPRVGA